MLLNNCTTNVILQGTFRSVFDSLAVPHLPEFTRIEGANSPSSSSYYLIIFKKEFSKLSYFVFFFLLGGPPFVTA